MVTEQIVLITDEASVVDRVRDWLTGRNYAVFWLPTWLAFELEEQFVEPPAAILVDCLNRRPLTSGVVQLLSNMVKAPVILMIKDGVQLDDKTIKTATRSEELIFVLEEIGLHQHPGD